MFVVLCPQAIPLPRLKSVLPLVFGRTEDKSSNVRKNAVQFLTSVLATNPFAAKVDLSPSLSFFLVCMSVKRRKRVCF